MMTRLCFCLFGVLTFSCSAPSPEDPIAIDANAVGEAQEPIVDVLQTPVERQSIGNCWLYAHASWIEAMHRRAADETYDTSQSYWTYMHWFRQITSGSGINGDGELQTGGIFYEARRITERYGLMAEQEFIEADSESEMSMRQKSALGAINTALAQGGALEARETRKNREAVRAALDEAWALREELVAHLDEAFGKGLERDFSRGNATAEGTPFIAAADFEVAYTRGDQPQDGAVTTTLARALDEWSYTSYPTTPARQRDVQRRVQRALHAREPVMVSWYVDFNALEARVDSPLHGSFNLQTLEEAGTPGRQGGHMTVLEDYEATISPLAEVFSEEATVADGTWAHLGSYTVNEGETLEVNMTGSGDADLYLRVGSEPTSKDYDCRPYSGDSREMCSTSEAGEVYVSVWGFSGHPSVDLEVTIYGSERETLKAGVTLDPENPEDARKLAAALTGEARIVLFRTKNSWGANRAGLPFAPGPVSEADGEVERGYHDLYMDYLTGPIADKERCQEVTDDEDGDAIDPCPRTITPLRAFILPPGF